MWSEAPEVRVECLYGDRRVRCFTHRPRSVDQLLREAAQCNPDLEACSDAERSLTYAELDKAASRIASGLNAIGVRPGDRVALLLGNRIEFVETFFGVMRAGAIAVPLNIRQQRAEIQYVLEDSGARVLIHEASLADRVPSRSDLPDLHHRYSVGTTRCESPPLSQLAVDGSYARPADDEESVAVILYTSGTTGKPKGAMLTHVSLITSAMHYQVCWHLRAGERAVLAVPASHVTGLVAIILAMVRVGGTTIMMQTFKAPDFLQVASASRMTYTLMVPAMYQLCLMQQDFDNYDLSGWRIGGYGGSPMPPATISLLATKLPNLQLVNAYGATETSSPSTLTPLGEGIRQRHTVGKPVPCAEIRIVDDKGNDVAPGEPGEIWIRGSHVVPGYWMNPSATQAAFVDGFWKSGDIGAFTEDGYLCVFDRKKDMINRGGYKVYSAEVEAVLVSHSAIVEAAVVPEPDPVLGEKVRAFVYAPAAQLSVDDVREYCKQFLSDYKVPDFVTFVQEPLPRNANGKILKRELARRSA